jgi:hypothetical protein
MKTNFSHDKYTPIAISAFILLTGWWVGLFLTGSTTGSANYLFGAVYGTFMATFGGIVGLLSAKKWGGFKSYLGKSITFLSLGLLAQAFGQIVFSAYNIFLKIEIPYPSLADLGYFGNIPLYFIGIVFLAHTAGIKLGLKNLLAKIQAVLIPLTILIFSYFMFLQGYEFDWTNPLKVFLDFAYPLGQAGYVSVALLTFILSKKFLGGIMRNKILILLAAFVLQYLADFNFLYQTSKGTWYNAGYGDYLYLLAYVVMAIGLFQIRNIAQGLSSVNK